MNQLIIIGNLTRDPELRTTQSGKQVCTFTVAVNRRQTAQAGQPEADFFRVSAWNELGNICQKWLIKGRKVAVTGRVSASAYQAQNGEIRANLEVMANDVEFLSPGNQAPEEAPQRTQQQDQKTTQQPQYNYPQTSGGFIQVDEEELPF